MSNKLRCLYAIALIILSVSCQDSSNQKHKLEPNRKSDSSLVKSAPTLPASSASQEAKKKSCIATVQHLVTWAKANLEKVIDNSFMGYTQPDSIYAINFKETDRYLAFLKSSGFFSQHFLDARNNVYKIVDSRFKREKQKEGLVQEMSYNIIFLSQEVDYILSNSGLFLYEQKGNDVFLKEKSQEGALVFKMNSACQIDSIYTRE